MWHDSLVLGDGGARSATQKLPIAGKNVLERQFTVIVSMFWLSWLTVHVIHLVRRTP
jgi:hypothetical protein